MALNINPLDGLYNALELVRSRTLAAAVSLNDLIAIDYWPKKIYPPLIEMSSHITAASSHIRAVRDKVAEVDAVLQGWKNTLDGIPAQIEARAAAYAQTVRNELTAWANNEVRPKIASLEQYRTDVENYFNQDLRPKVNGLIQYRTDVENYFNQDLRPKVNSSINRLNVLEGSLAAFDAAKLEAYFSNTDRPSFERTWNFWVQNSLWNFRNKVEGSAEWDPIKAEATDRANAALAAANQNISAVDARLAAMIESSSGRTTDLENELPRTTAALNKRIDQANQAATDQANAALAAANQNILTTKAELDQRVRKLEVEIEKVAPVLARLPKIPVG
jgi:hypothetical protein